MIRQIVQLVFFKTLPVDSFAINLASDHFLPVLVCLLDHFEGKTTRLGLGIEGELIGRLSIGHLVNPEPLDSSCHESWHVLLDILDVYNKQYY